MATTLPFSISSARSTWRRCAQPHDDPPAKVDAGLSPAQLRAKAIVELEAEFAQLSAKVRVEPNPKAACAAVLPHGERGAIAIWLRERLERDHPTFLDVPARWLREGATNGDPR